ncbi:AMP-binding protein [Streptomyces sp. NPDC090075]|uniref:AMP-binding protein n=1 Tax=Streptomyces sp. NPDC090075 TaxID=3365937 RepID=UPI00381101EB
MIYRSPLSGLHIPPVFLSDHVLADAASRSDRAALVDAATGEVVTYGELVRAADRGAAGLVAGGIAPGDVVAVMSHNQPRFAVAVHAVLRAGAVISPLNPVLTVEEIVKQLIDSRARALIVAESSADKGTEAARAAGVPHVFVLGTHPENGSWDDLVADARPMPPALTANPAEALAVLPYSSGTTGMAKGVMLTHRNLVANLEQLAQCWRLTEDDVLCAALPFFHIYGFTIILNSALLAGATVVTLPRFELRPFLDVVQRHGVTRGHLAPPMVLALAQAGEVDEYDLSSMRTAICGAAPLDEALAERAEKRIGCVIRQGFGMTEASPGTHCAHDEVFASTPAGAAGQLLPNTEARLVDPVSGEDVPPGESGELWVRGPQVMAGYLANPQATAQALTDEGWLRTGDIARVDEHGYFFVVDRLKELIKYKGYQVAPAELEALLLTHPDVTDAAVVAMPHPTGGEAPKAFVVTSGAVDPQELLDWVAARVAPYKRIRAVGFIDAIPKSPAGKILRRRLKGV